MKITKLNFDFFRSQTGSGLVEFVFCVPVISLFFYGSIYLNSFFDKHQRMEIQSRSLMYSANYSESKSFYNEDLNFKKENNLDEDKLFKSTVKLNKSNFNFKIPSLSTSIQGAYGGNLKSKMSSTILGKLLGSSRYKNKIEAVKLDPDNTNSNLDKIAGITVNGEVKRELTLKSEINSILSTGYLGNPAYVFAPQISMIVGYLNSNKWSSDYLIQCLLVYKPYTECNGTNNLYNALLAADFAKFVVEILSYGGYTATTSAISSMVQIAIDQIINIVTDMAIEELKQMSLDMIKEKIAEQLTKDSVSESDSNLDNGSIGLSDTPFSTGSFNPYSSDNLTQSLDPNSIPDYSPDLLDSEPGSILNQIPSYEDIKEVGVSHPNYENMIDSNVSNIGNIGNIKDYDQIFQSKNMMDKPLDTVSDLTASTIEDKIDNSIDEISEVGSKLDSSSNIDNQSLGSF